MKNNRSFFMKSRDTSDEHWKIILTRMNFAFSDNSSNIVTTHNDSTPTPSARDTRFIQFFLTYFQCIFQPIRLSGACHHFTIDSKAQNIVGNLIIVGYRCLFRIKLWHLSKTRRIRLIHFEHNWNSQSIWTRTSEERGRRGKNSDEISWFF